MNIQVTNLIASHFFVSDALSTKVIAENICQRISESGTHTGCFKFCKRIAQVFKQHMIITHPSLCKLVSKLHKEQSDWELTIELVIS